MRIGLTTTVLVSEHACAADVEGTVILLHSETGDFCVLDDVGGEVWRNLDVASNSNGIAEQISGAKAADIATVLDRLLGLGLVRTVPARSEIE